MDTKDLKGESPVTPIPPNLISACDRALCVVLRIDEMSTLYRKALRTYGEGPLRSLILNAAVDALDDPNVSMEVFTSGDHMFSFLCGVWLQFLLTEVAGLKKENLRALFEKMIIEVQESKSLH
jgi:hypothetical protein